MKSGFRPVVLTAIAALVLAACGGGGSGSTSTGATSISATSSALSGTVAVGGAIAGANVNVIDVNGQSVSTTTDASGNYTISLAGLSAPLLILASDPTGVHSPLASVLGSIPSTIVSPVDAASSVVGNVTTLTTAVAALLTTSGNPLDLSSSGSLSSLAQSASISAAKRS